MLNTVYLFVSGLVAFSYLGWRYHTAKLVLELQDLAISQGIVFKHLDPVPPNMYPMPQVVQSSLIVQGGLLLSLGLMWSIRHGDKRLCKEGTAD